ncbi:MAG TPA: beta-propeller domain-containing protein, partial [Tepidisphaeraceae bacterium]|nr:beta-propeller domain-containing protein [Tepidisphaeraceae bacterium]
MSSRVRATSQRAISAFIESLEKRQLLSTAAFYSSSLQITGDETDDRIVVQYKPDHSGALQVILNGQTYDQLPNTSITWIYVNLGAGNDQLSFSRIALPSLRTYISAGSGNDSISASQGEDNIEGDDGDDLIFGRGGDDSLMGEAGDDRIVGGTGNDQINGRTGNDWLFGGKGQDSLAGSSGKDSIFGAGGADKLVGDAGDDLLSGGDGNDIIAGGVGNDQILGDSGNDQLHGDYGQDNLSGGGGSDTLWGGASADQEQGGALSDTIYRQPGIDQTRTDKTDKVKTEVLTAPLARKADAATLKASLIDAAVRQWQYRLGDQDVPYWAYRFYDRSSDGKLFQIDPETGQPTKNSLLGGGCSGGDYSQTNIQEQGVDEADQVKTDGQNIYLLDDNRLIIMAASPAADSHIISTTDIAGQAIGLYLDRNFLTVLSQGEKTVGNCPGDSSNEGLKDGDACEASQTIFQSRVTVYDVSDPAAPVVVEENTFDGSIATSRSIDGKLYLMLNNSFNAPSPKAVWHEEPPLDPDWNDDTNDWTVAPGIPAWRDYGDKEYLVQASGYFEYETEKSYRKRLQAMPLEKFSPGYTSTNSTAPAVSGELLNPATVYLGPDFPNGYGDRWMSSIVSVDPTDGKLGIGSSAAIVGSSGLAYISRDSLYLASNREDTTIEGMGSEDRTDLYKFQLGEKNINLVASGQAPGSVLNEFSMDEEAGRLRIATTSGRWDDASNNVMVLAQDGDALRVQGGLTGLASSERIYSARFEGDRGYLVTFRQVDPLFVIDLADPINPKVAGELKVPGFSSYLNPIDDHLIIGVGQDAGETGRRLGLQVSLFDVADSSNPARLQNFTFAPKENFDWTSSIAESDHHAFSWFPAQQTLAIPVSHNGDRGYEAMTYVLKITRAGITLVGTVSQPGYAVRNVR